MHIESGGMGSYDVTKVVFTWRRYKRCLIAPLSLVFSSSFICGVACLQLSILVFFATVPGIPEVSVQQAEDGATVLSWKLKCKNGKIEKYMVTYFDVDDTSDDESLTTPETEQRIQKLNAGKTYEFQVSCFLSYHPAVTEPGTDLLNMTVDLLTN